MLAHEIITRLKFKNGKHIFDDDISRLEHASYKMKPFYWPFQTSTTTINQTIWFPKPFPTYDAIAQEAIFIHESVHLKQYADGIFSIYEYLTRRETRFQLEIAAEKREILYRVYVGQITKSNIGDYAINQANVWPGNYKITSMKKTNEWFQLFRGLCEEAFATLAPK